MAALARRLRVLLIDDNEDTRDMYAAYLAAVGLDVRTAADGEKALRLVEDWRPDLIVSDWSMPGMTGDEVTRRLKSEPTTRHIPVVIVTAFGLEQHTELEAAGAAAVCAKPCAPHALADVIKGLVPASVPGKPAGRRRSKRV